MPTPLLRPSAFTRREFLTLTGAVTLGVAASGWWRTVPLRASDAANTDAIAPLNRFPRMVQEYFVEQVRAAERQGDERRAALKTKADAERCVEDVRRRIRESFGPFPEKTPLNPQITGTVERDTYTIEKVLFESRPGFFVSANLYLPKDRSSRRPGVVGTCGHSANGKAAEPYQSFAQGLARLGYVCLIYDPIGQGERLQYVDEKLKSHVGAGVAEHLHAGNQQFLVGEFFGTWRAWDGVRALDYLLTRDEVDPQQIGVTGNSGGGTMTTWLCGVEQRWTMAAPSCFVTTFRRNMENELPADTEQCPPKALALGLDHSDFLAALAPKPIVILAKEKDYFDVRGSIEAYERLKRLYTLLGAEENINLFIGPTGHGYSQENREAMYRWFNRATGVSDAESEPGLVIEKDETLWCAPRGQVSELGSRTVFSFTVEKSAALAEKRGTLDGDALRTAVAETLKLPEQRQNRTERPHARILRPRRRRKYPKPHAATYAVETEPGVQAVVYRLDDEAWHSRPPQSGPQATLYISHRSADAELREEPLLTELIENQPDGAFFTCDVRGIGDSQPDTTNENSYLSPYGSDYFYAIHSIMLDRPYVGQRTWDVLRVLDWLRHYGHSDVHLVATGWGTLPATFAALLADEVKKVTLKHSLTSYRNIAESEEYDWPLSALLPNVLERFDLPDCYRALKAKGLRLIEPWDAQGQIVS